MSSQSLSDPDRSSACLKWDDRLQVQEGYLQLPDQPELRLTPAREGDEDDLVRPQSSYEPICVLTWTLWQ